MYTAYVLVLCTVLLNIIFVLLQDEGIDCIIVDEWIKFRANRRIARLVKVQFDCEKRPIIGMAIS